MPKNTSLDKTSQEFIKYLESAGISTNSLKFYKSDLNHFTGWFLLRIRSLGILADELTQAIPFLKSSHSQEYKQYLLENKESVKTINRRLSTLRNLSRFLTQSQIINFNFMEGLTNIAIAGEERLQIHPLVVGFQKHLEAEKVSVSTIKNYLADIRQFISPGLPKITPELLKAYFEEISKGPSQATAKRKIASLKKFVAWAQKQGHFKDAFLFGKNIFKKAFYASLQDKIIKRLEQKPRIQKIVNSLFYKRPNWYRTYHDISITNYIHIAILVIFSTALGFGAYNQFFKGTSTPLAYPTSLTPTLPNRFLSFQGRLTDDLGNPQPDPTTFVFKLYDAATAGNTLWNAAGTSCEIDPDEDGIFSTLLGSTCPPLPGGAIAATVFSEHPDVWLGVKVEGDDEASPRIQIATVGYALNAETLQGYPPSATGTINTIPIINNDGDLIIGAASPTIQSTSGTFGIDGQAISIITTAASNGNITIAPNGTGQLLLVGGTTATDFARITDANLDSGDLISGYVGNETATGNLLSLSSLSGASETDRFTVSRTGQTYIAGSVGIGTTNPATTALLDLTSTTKGFLAPRMTTVERDAIVTPATGLMIYNTTDNQYNVFDSATWGAVGGGGGAWNDLTDPTDNLTLTMGAFTTTFNWDSLTTGTGLTGASTSLSSGTLASLSVNGTAAAGNTQKVLSLSTAGANTNPTQTTYGLYSTNTHTGTASTNVGGYFSASGGTNNYAAIFDQGNVGIGTTGPLAALHLGSDAGTVASGIQFGSDVDLYRKSANLLQTSDSLQVSGIIYNNQISNTATGNNASLFLAAGGAAITRNIADANPVLYIQQVNASSTGDILQLKNNSSTVMTVQQSGNVGIGTTGPTETLDVAGDIRSTTGSLQIGNSANLAYSRLGTVATGHAANLTTSDDLLLSGDLELNGVLYLDGSIITNSAGTSSITLSSAPTTTANNLSASNWLIENTANLGQAALMVNQTLGGDIFTASVSGAPKFVISNIGRVGIGTTAPSQALDVSGTITSSTGNYTSQVADGTTATAFTLNTTTALSTQGAKLLSVQNFSAEKFYIDKDGNLYTSGTILSGNGQGLLVTNKSGGTIANRSLVVLDTANNSGFTTTTTAYNKAAFGVVTGVGLGVTNDADGDGACDANDICMVAVGGEVEVLLTNALTTVKGDYVYTTTTAGSGVASAKQFDGLIGVVSNTSGSASGYVKIIFKPQPQVSGSPFLEKADTSLADGSYVEIIHNTNSANVIANGWYWDGTNWRQVDTTANELATNSTTVNFNTEANYTQENMAYAVTLTPSAVSGDITLTLGSGTWNSDARVKAGCRVTGNGGVANLTATPAAQTTITATSTTNFTNTNAIASGSWYLYCTTFDGSVVKINSYGPIYNSNVGTFATTSQEQLPQTARLHSTVTATIGGTQYLYVTGGYSTAALSTIYKAIIDASGNVGAFATTSQGQLLVTNYAHSTVTATIGGTSYLYVTGGSTGSAVYKAAIDSSGNVGTFATTSQAQLPVTRSQHSTVTATIGGTSYLYVTGGSSSSTIYKAIIDASGNVGAFATTSQGQLPQAFYAHSTVTATIGGTSYLYVTGGYSTVAISTVYKATIDASGNVGAFATTSQGQLPKIIYTHSTVTATIGGTQYLYVTGGYSTAILSTIYKAAIDASGNVGTFATTSQGQLPTNIYYFSTVTATIGGTQYLYVTGGYDDALSKSIIYKATIGPNITTAPTSTYYTTVTNGDQISTSAWQNISSVAVTETLNSQTAYYAVSFDGRTTFYKYDSTTSDNGWRGVARNNSGTWQYNSNTTAGVSNVTWTSATYNSQNGAISQAVGVTANQMTGTQLAAVTESQWRETNGYTPTTATLDFAVALYTNSESQIPQVDQIKVNYTKAGFKIVQTDSNTVRMYNYTGSAKNVKLNVIPPGGGGSPGAGAGLFTNNNSSVADSSYVEVAHNQNTSDFVSNGWKYNTATSKWEAIDVTANELAASSTTVNFNTEASYSQENMAYSVTLTPSATSGDITLTLGSGTWNADARVKAGCRVTGNGGVATITGTPAAQTTITATTTTNFTNTSAIASGSWYLYCTTFDGSVVKLNSYLVYGSNVGTFATTSQGQLPAIRYDHSTVTATIGGTQYIYVTGGHNGTATTSTIYKATIDSSGNIGAFATTSQGQLPAVRYNHSTVTTTIGGTQYIYVTGGDDSGGVGVSTVYKATIDSSGNIGAFATTSQGQLPAVLDRHSTVTATIGGTQYIYVTGGLGASVVSTVYKATIDSSGNIGAFATTSQGQLPAVLDKHSAVTATIGGTQYIYVTGGADTAARSTVYKATIDSSGNIGAFATTSQGQLPATRYVHSTVTATIGGTQYIYVTGGADSGDLAVSTVYKATIGPDTTATPTSTYYTTVTNGDQISTSAWQNISSVAVTETLNSQTAYYAVSFDARTTFYKYDSTTADNGWRAIARNYNSGTWQYNSNVTAGVSNVTWTSATYNSQNGAISQAVGVTANQMTGTQLAAVTELQWRETNGYTPTTATLDFAVALYTSSASQIPQVDQIKVNYTKAGFKIIQQDANTVRLYNYSGLTQNLRLDVITGGLGRNAGTVSLAPAAADVDSQTDTNSIWLNKTGSGGNLLKLQTSGTDVLSLTSAGTMTLAGNFLPATDNLYNLGASSSARFKDLFLGPASLHIQSKSTDAGYPALGLDYALGINTAGSLGVSLNSATPSFVITSAGQVGIGTTSPASKVHAVTDDATTNAITDVLTLDHTTSGTAADNIGTGILFRSEDNAGNTVNAGRVSGILADVTSSNPVSAITFDTRGTIYGNAGTFATTSQGQLPQTIVRHSTVTATIGGTQYMYVTGGYGAGGANLSTVYKATIDASGNMGAFATTSQGQLPTLLQYPSTVTATIGGTQYLYVTGGYNLGAKSNVYKATIDSSGNVGAFATTSQGQLLQGIYNTSTVTASIGGTQYLYVTGGYGAAAISTVYKAAINASGNVGTFSTTSQKQLPVTLWRHSTVTASIGGTQYLYVTGGSDAANYSAVYKAAIDASGNVGTFSTTSQGQLPATTYDHSTVTAAIGGTQYMYVTGGEGRSTVYKAQIDASGNAGTFATTSQAQLPATTYYHSTVTAAIGGTQYLYVTGGYSGGAVASIVYKASLAIDNATLTRTAKLDNAGGLTISGTLTQSGSPDIAENVTVTDPTIEAGDVVMIDQSYIAPADADIYHRGAAKKADKPYDQNLLGIISTSPGIIINAPKDSVNSDQRSQENERPLAIAGRVPVKIAPDSAPIAAGDFLTSSATYPGMAMKATKAGYTVGKALESWNPASAQGSGEAKPTIEVFVNLGYFDPDLAFTDSGDLQIIKSEALNPKSETNSNDQNSNDQKTATDNATPSATLAYRIIKESTQEVIDRIGAFSEVVAANIRAGAIKTKDFTTNTFLAFQGTIDNLLINNGLVSPIVQTNLISPLADSTDVVIKLGKSATSGEPELTPEESSGFGKLIIQNPEGEEVASIDSSGSAEFRSASVSGELYAESIVSPDLDKIQELLRQVKEDQELLAQASTWGINTATDSAQIINSLQTMNLYVTDQAAINSLSVSNSFAVGTDMVIQALGTSGLGNSINTLTAPLSLQSLALAPVEIMAGKVRIDTNGNMIITGNLNVAGDLEVSGKTKLKEVELEKLIIAQSPTSRESSSSATLEVKNGEIQTNATAGKATIPAGVSEITINNPNVTDYTLVYVTPTSTTNNNVLFVKSKKVGQFVVGFNQVLDVDVKFNWWVIEIK